MAAIRAGIKKHNRPTISRDGQFLIGDRPEKVLETVYAADLLKKGTPFLGDKLLSFWRLIAPPGAVPYY
jgi:hypothetical protein